MYTVLLYYKFHPITDPQAEVKAQTELCQSLELKGRVLINEQGINGTVGGSKEACDKYIEYMNQHPEFKNIDWKISQSDREPFSKIRIRYRDEVITTNAKEKIDLNQRGQHVDRDTFHQWLVNKEPMILVDMRNDYEWDIGRFKGADRPPVAYFRDLDDNMEFYSQFKDHKVVMYCTGGIRCEPASALFIAHGFKVENLYQLEGGIVKYAEKYGDDGYFEGSCYVFDERMKVPINTSSTCEIVGRCILCGSPTEMHRNCANKMCNKLLLACDKCAEKYENTCSENCREIIGNPENARVPHGNDIRVLHRNKL